MTVTGMGIIDTGATYTHIDNEIVRICRFRTLRTMKVDTAGQRGLDTPLYDALLEILDLPGHREQLQVLGFTGLTPIPGDPPEARVIALIGRNILDRGRFIYDGAARTFTLELP